MKLLARVLLSSLFFIQAASICDSCGDDGAGARLALLQHKVEGRRRSEEKVPAVISAMYTFGAPAASRSAMPDLNQADRCFRGLRTYTETKSRSGARQVDAASIFGAAAHPLIATLALDWDQDSFYQPCPGETSWPERGVPSWLLHYEDRYLPRLQNVSVKGVQMATEEPFKTANEMVTLAYKSYDSVENTIKELKQKLPNWRLVDRQVFEWNEVTYDEDPIMVAQRVDTLDCALIFAGTNNLPELGSSLKKHVTGYCGFEEVHAGYRDEVWQLSNHAVWSLITASLGKCSSVTCVGHSLGGAMCDVLSSCINSGRKDDPDYEQLMWFQGKPELMPEIGSDEELQALGGINSLGKVDSLYTYGSPAVAKPPLQDSKSADGCFKGLRAYVENDLPSGRKQADARALNRNFFPHPKMHALSLQWDQASHLASCKEEDSQWWPHHSLRIYEDWSLHTVEKHAARLETLHTQNPESEVYAESSRFVQLAFSVDKPQKDVQEMMRSRMDGWWLVGREACADEAEHVLLAQDQVSFACVLVMPGNTEKSRQFYGTSYCGMPNVHSGHRDYLVRTVQSKEWIKIAQKLPSCRRVICAGHSRGGSSCELFAACVNNGSPSDPDFRRLRWVQAAPGALMPLPEAV